MKISYNVENHPLPICFCLWRLPLFTGTLRQMPSKYISQLPKTWQTAVSCSLLSLDAKTTSTERYTHGLARSAPSSWMGNCTAYRQGLCLKILSPRCFLVCFAERKIPHLFSSAFFQINSVIHWSYRLNSKCRMFSLLYPVTDEIQSVQSLGMPKNPLQKMLCYAVKSNGWVLKNNCMQPSTHRRDIIDRYNHVY